MPNLRSKTWTTTTPAAVTDAQYWEDHLIGGTLTLVDSGGETLGVFDGSTNVEIEVGTGAGGGHVIEDADGTEMTQEPILQFLNAEVTEGTGKTIVDCQGEKGDKGDKGDPGDDGADGVSVTSVELLSTSGKNKTYRMSFSNGTHFDYVVTDGADGGGSGDMLKSTYDSNDDGSVDSADTLKGLTASVSELNYVDGVSSNIQTQLDSKINNPAIEGTNGQVLTTDGQGGRTWTTVQSSGGDMLKSVYDTDNDGIVDSAETLSGLTASITELNYMDGATENIQAALNMRPLRAELDSWTSEATLASGNTVTFTGLNDSYGYELFSVDDEKPISWSDCTKTGSGTSMQLVYTVSGASLQVGISKFVLRILK